MGFHSFPKIAVVATSNLFLKPVFFFGSPSGRDSGCDSWRLHWDARESSHLIRYANLMWFFIIFSFLFLFIFLLLSLFACVYICFLE